VGPVVQEEATGCGIASVANILGKTYSEMKEIANGMGVDAADTALWSDTQYVRRMLRLSGVGTSADEIPFVSWDALPDLALLAIKHYRAEGKNFWHWVVFRRLDGQSLVLDSASYLPSNVRTDFGNMQPKWFIEVKGCDERVIANGWRPTPAGVSNVEPETVKPKTVKPKT